MNPMQRMAGADEVVLVESSPDRCPPTQQVPDEDEEVLEEDEVRALVRSNAMVGHKRPRGFIDAADLSDMDDGMDLASSSSLEEHVDEWDPPAWIKECDPLRYMESFEAVGLAERVGLLKAAHAYLAQRLKVEKTGK